MFRSGGRASNRHMRVRTTLPTCRRHTPPTCFIRFAYHPVGCITNSSLMNSSLTSLTMACPARNHKAHTVCVPCEYRARRRHDSADLHGPPEPAPCHPPRRHRFAECAAGAASSTSESGAAAQEAERRRAEEAAQLHRSRYESVSPREFHPHGQNIRRQVAPGQSRRAMSSPPSSSALTVIPLRHPGAQCAPCPPRPR
jgi:hypothetical protein